jgi:microcystin-dependent protein
MSIFDDIPTRSNANSEFVEASWWNIIKTKLQQAFPNLNIENGDVVNDGPITLKELDATPTTPAVTYKRLYAKDDGKLYTLNSDGDEIEVGSGAGGVGGINFFNLQSSDFVDGTQGDWLTDDGSGTDSSVLSFAIVEPGFTGGNTARFLKSAADGEDHFFKCPMTFFEGLGIPEAYRGTTVFGSFLYDLTQEADYESGDYVLEAWDVTGSPVQLYTGPEPLELLKSKGRFDFTVSLESTTEDVEIRIVCKTDKTDAFTDNQFGLFRLGPASVLTMREGPVGEVVAMATDVAPPLFLEANGAQVSRTTYAELFSIIGTRHGTGDGSTTFHLPDYRGRFLRGQADGQATDPDRASRTAMATGGATGDNVGSVQGHETASHAHAAGSLVMRARSIAANSTDPADRSLVTSAANIYRDGAQDTNMRSGTIGGSTAVNGGSETRPVNAYVKYFIRYSSGGNTMTTNELGLQSGAFRASRNGTNQTGVNPNNSAVKVNINSIASANDYAKGLSYDEANARFVNLGPDAVFDLSAGLNLLATNVVTGARYRAEIRVNGTSRVFGTQYPAPAAAAFTLNASGSFLVPRNGTVELYLHSSANHSTNQLTVTGDINATFLAGTRRPDLTLIGAVRNDEYLEASRVLTTTSIPTTANWGDVTSLTLGPGTWDLTAIAVGSTAGSGSGRMGAGISTTSGNVSPGDVGVDRFDQHINTTVSFAFSVPASKKNVTITTPTTFYLKWIRSSTDISSWGGKLEARRIK